ncbi:MAG: hypothetical protein QG564_1467 [Campylobacterota bacterium]|nr:hypothetical protein [Campylobacterota bacterium]
MAEITLNLKEQEELEITLRRTTSMVSVCQALILLM